MEQNKELLIRNDPEAIELRKKENTLVVIGSGVILFGVWSIVKALLYTVSDRAEFLEEIYDNGLGTAGVVFSIAVVGLVLLADLGLRFYVGRSAIAEGRGHKKSALYLVLAGLMAGASVIMLLMVIFIPGDIAEGILDRIVSVVVEGTSLVMVCEMIWAGICVRRERAREETAGSESPDAGAGSPFEKESAGR